MAQQKNDRLAPPLMHAFRVAHSARDAKTKLDIRDGGERVIASRRVTNRAPITESELRKYVNTALVALLNTTNFDAAVDLSEAPHVRNSILNYGFPDLSWRTIDETSVASVAREIETALSDFEPQLWRGSVKAKRDDTATSDELRLRFLVKAELRAHPVNMQMEFIAEIELDSGKIKIDRVER
jgi:type VI secretion system protein ImpF